MSRAHRMIQTPLDGEARTHGQLMLSGPPPSLNNVFMNAKKGRFKSPLYSAWRAVAHLELRRQGAWHVPGRIRVMLAFNRAETKADLDNLIKPILDLLVGAGRIADDRNVVALGAAFNSDAKGTLIKIEAAHG